MRYEKEIKSNMKQQRKLLKNTTPRYVGPDVPLKQENDITLKEPSQEQYISNQTYNNSFTKQLMDDMGVKFQSALSSFKSSKNSNYYQMQEANLEELLAEPCERFGPPTATEKDIIQMFNKNYKPPDESCKFLPWSSEEESGKQLFNNNALNIVDQKVGQLGVNGDQSYYSSS